MPDNPASYVTRSAEQRTAKPPHDPHRFAVEAAAYLNEMHCEDVVAYDLRELSPVTQYIVIATGTSDRQIKSLASHVGELGRSMGFERYGSDRDDASTWAVLDHVEVVVHLFEPATRGHYDLEMLWGDAPRVNWRQDAA